MLVGHSPWRFAAGWLAAQGSPYDVTQVVTAGSPVGSLGPFPPGTSVLSLENAGDVIPLLDGTANAPAANHVTVTFDDPAPSIADAHDLRHYAAGAAGVDGSADPSVVDQLDRLRSEGFLGGAGEARSQVFQITRAT
ncbi:MAG: hypothetical protein R2731_09780 [Nocardioides sp.]